MPRRNGAPPLWLWFRETLEIPGLLASPLLPAVPIPAGRGQPVIVLPGYLTTDLSSIRLRRSLRAAGYEVQGWQLGRNWGGRARLLEALVARISVLHRQYGEKVIMVGWSLGGLYAREAAKLVPDLVAMVVTLGSPFSGNPRANNAWRIYEFLNNHRVDNPPIGSDLRAKPPVQTVAMWSPRDGIIAPEAARGAPGESDLQVEVHCQHFNFARAPAGIRAIGQVLADYG